MSNTVPGVNYPREVAGPPGLPPGWKAIERAYSQSSKSFGRTYIRYDSPSGKHKTLSSVKLCVQKDAEDKGLDVEKAVKEFERAQQEAKDAKQKEREEAGQMAGAKREEAVEAFRAKFGELNGATVAKLPGWHAESIYRETCGQTAVTYFSPEGKAYGTVKSVEAFFGMQVLAGREIDCIREARANVQVDDHGKPINEVRREITINRNLDGDFQVHKKPRLAFDEESYHDSNLLVAPTNGQLPKQLEAAGTSPAERDRLQRDAAELRRRLVTERHFDEPEAGAGLVLAVVGCPTGHRLAKLVAGLFYQLPEGWNNRPCYQRVSVGDSGALTCVGVYIFWSMERSCWKIGPLNDSKAGWAFCVDNRATPTEVEARWKIFAPS